MLLLWQSFRWDIHTYRMHQVETYFSGEHAILVVLLHIAVVLTKVTVELCMCDLIVYAVTACTTGS